MDEFITISDAQERYGHSREWWIRRIRRGLFRSLQLSPQGTHRLVVSDIEDLIDTAEAARLLGTTIFTIRRAVKAGRIPTAGECRGGPLKFRRSELRNLAAAPAVSAALVEVDAPGAAAPVGAGRAASEVPSPLRRLAGLGRLRA